MINPQKIRSPEGVGRGARTRLRAWPWRTLLLAIFVLTTGPATRAGAQAPEKRTYTEAELDQVKPRWPNPYLSFLPADAEPDWDFWRAKMRLESRRRAAKRAPGIPHAVATVDEDEPADSSGWNDAQATAEFVEGFGTGAGDAREVDVAGTLAAPPPLLVGPFAEDNGSIPLASETGLTSGRRVRTRAFVGDGPYGSLELGTGDFDVYRIAGVRAGQVVTVDIDTVEPATGRRLDTKVALYDSTGYIVDLNDDGEAGSPDSFLEVAVPADGTYYVFVRGVNSFWPTDPFDSASGSKAGSEGPYTITLGLDAIDLDFFSFDLQAGDVLGINLADQAQRVTLFDPAGRVLVGSDLDASILYAKTSPLPHGGNATLAYVVDTAGRYAVSAARGAGPYTLALRLFRPLLEGPPAGLQTLFLDFDGAALDAETLYGGHPNAVLSPMASFLDRFGLDPTPGGADENAVIDAVLAVLEENLAADIHAFGLNPAFQIELLNSRDHADPFGEPAVSRIVIGGTRDELGVNTVGISESVDVGNFAWTETAVVLLDLLSTSGNVNSLQPLKLDPGVSAVDLLGTALGNIASHEAGHLFANFHTGHPDAPSNLMDGSPYLPDFLGMGRDEILGSGDDVDVDFGPAPYNDGEGFTGTQDTRNAIAFGLFGSGTSVSVETPPADAPETYHLSAAFPNPFRGQTRLLLRLGRPQQVRVEVYDLLGRRVRALFDGWLPAGTPHLFTLEAGDLPSGAYLVRATGTSFQATRPVVVVR